MTETVPLAGISPGAAVSPVVELVTTAATARADDKSTRIKAAAEFSAARRTLTSRQEGSWDPLQMSCAYDAAVTALFEVAKTILRGAIRALAPVRVAAADYSCRCLLCWVRGDLKPGDLNAFDLHPDGEGDTSSSSYLGA